MRKNVALLISLMGILVGVVSYQVTRPPEEIDLAKYEGRAYSQGGEDGVVEQIFKVIEPTSHFGASIQSLYELGKKKGYELVYGTSSGLNLFFVDRRYFARFGIRDNSPSRFYRPPLYGVERGGRAPNGRGHPPWDLWAQTKDGQPVKPFAADLTWQRISIPKKLVPLP